MTDKTSKKKTKRLSKGQRTYVRRNKQAARNAGCPGQKPRPSDNCHGSWLIQAGAFALY